MVTFTSMKLILRIYLTFLGLLMTNLSLHAQEDPPPPPPSEEEVLPIDGGVFILLAISILFGLYKLYQYKQQKKIPV